METVSIARCEEYVPETVERALEEALVPLGGMGAFVTPGQRVLLKVNLLSRATPDRAVTTHPTLVRALIRSVRAAGGTPVVGDSPGGPNTRAMVRNVWEDSGIGAVCSDEAVELVLFDEDCTRVSCTDGELFTSFTVGRAVASADVVISVPKFKTHGFMMFTGAVKNLFGCIPGLEKAQFHLRVPGRDDFGSMLVDLMLACRPTLSVMDAVVGMEGEGPAGGKPRKVGALIASPSAPALDFIAASMAGLDPLEVYSTRAAARRGLGPASLDDIEVRGADWRALSPEGFELPPRDVRIWGAPRWLTDTIAARTVARPVLERRDLCTRCRKCETVCPVGACHVGADGPTFEMRTCIRCYCCQELCPPQAIGLRVPILARLATRGRSR